MNKEDLALKVGKKRVYNWNDEIEGVVYSHGLQGRGDGGVVHRLRCCVM